MAQLPADRTKLALAQSNQVPQTVASSSRNINALTEVYDTVDMLYGYVNQTLQGIYDSGKFSKLGIINVKDAPFNAVGDGVADDTDAMRAAINAAGSSKKPLYIPAGVYNISDTLEIGFYPGLRIIGAGKELTRIRMTADNKPILKTLKQDTHSVMIENLNLEYATQQNGTSHPNSRAVCFYNDTSNANGIYYWIVRNVRIINATDGFSIDSSGQLPVWGCVFDCITLSSITRHGFNLASSTAVGQPCNKITNLRAVNASTVATGECIRQIAGELWLENIDIEDWDDQIFYLSALTAEIRNVHIERHTYNSDNKRLMYAPASRITMDNWTVNTNTNSFNNCWFVFCEQTKLYMGNVTFTGTLSPPVYLVNGAHNDNFIIISTYYDDSTVKVYRVGFVNTWQRIFQVNGEPLGLSAAPTAGTFAVGMKFKALTPAAGGYSGWVCVTAGTPGTWKGYGAIES